jgi:Tol biopolymer transport system component
MFARFGTKLQHRFGVPALPRGVVIACLGVLAVGATPALAAFPGDNGRLSFASDRAGFDVFTMTATGGDLLNLTQDSEAADDAGRWRADGRKVVFMSDRETPTNPAPPGFPSPDFELFMMDADGSHVRQLTFNQLDDETPAWSPDGMKVVFMRDFDPVRGQADYDVLALSLDGRPERNLTSSPGIDDRFPSWAPHGGRVAFTSDRDGDLEIYTMNQSGSSLRQLTSNEIDDFAPNWSPDGKKIALPLTAW